MGVDPGGRGTGPPKKIWSGGDTNIDVSPKFMIVKCIFVYDFVI